ncbi:hypothetical protein BG011_000791 [Mortierella polycephala]|uniref:FAR1 domain-containing protein n=1 Tax=Mortierella polycephala TaxID=41804 RepID=A0A9P6PLJ1_9FUNG|nr:hypothetical protein BG011_000791 [Mortierella polycephala]
MNNNYDEDAEIESEEELMDPRKARNLARNLALSDSIPTVSYDETDAESEHGLVDPRKTRRMAASNSKSTADTGETRSNSVNPGDGQGQHIGSLRETDQVQIRDSLMETLSLDVGNIDEIGLRETQESVMNAFADLEEQLGPMDADHDDNLDNDQDDSQDETRDGKIELARENMLEAGRMATRACIFADDFIAKAAKALFIEIDQRINESCVNENGRCDYRLEFYILDGDFEDWKRRHECFLGTRYNTPRRVHKYTGRNATHYGFIESRTFLCHREGKLRIAKAGAKQPATGVTAGGDPGGEQATECDADTQQGSSTAVKRKRARTVKAPSIKIGCHSKMVCRLQSKDRPDGSPIKAFYITYSYQHNHTIAIDTDFRARYLSDEKKATIERLLQAGSPVREVLQRMRGNAEKLLQHGKRRIFRDDIITYEDVYNIHYSIMTKEIHKHESDPETSAQMWMEELKDDQFYTCYERGTFYAFSSP